MSIDGIGPGGGGPADWSERLISLRKTTEDIGTSLEPDADWMPTVLVEGTFPADMPNVKPEMIGKEGIVIIGLAGGFMNSDQSKDLTAIIMTGAAKALQAKGMTFISTIWMIEYQNSQAESDYIASLPEEEKRKYVYDLAKAQGPPREHPNRKERLMLMSVYYGGEDDGTKIAYADIKREKEKHPILFNWKLMDGSGENFFGRFPEAIYAGLRMAAEDRAKGAK